MNGAVEAEVTGLGADGDGVVAIDGSRRFVAYTLPGETVRLRAASGRLALDMVLQASPERVTPPCRLFGHCGGCSLQHMSPAAMMAFKRDLVRGALIQAGFPMPERISLVACPAASRRRADLGLRRTTERIVIGLHQRGGDLVDLSECHVLEPALFGLVTALRPMLLRLSCLRRTGSALINLLDSGPDLLLATERPPDAGDRVRLADFAQAAGLPRISWRPLKASDAGAEAVCTLAPVHHDVAGARIAPPAGAFLQPSQPGEAAIVDAVLAALQKQLRTGARIVELYAGCGTLSFALAARGRVVSIEGDRDAAACLAAGIKPGMRMQAVRRDLARQPLLASEFSRAGAIVLDPPFDGAGPQMPEIAKSRVARIVMVSCNPRALGKDAALLRTAGYRLEQLSVIDQFVWSSGVESVAVFARDKRSG